MSLWKGFFPTRGLWWAGRFFLALAFFLSISTTTAWGQIQYFADIVWEQMYTESPSTAGFTDKRLSLAVGPRDEAFVSGEQGSPDSSNLNMYTFKYDGRTGSLTGASRFDYEGLQDRPNAMTVDRQGNAYLVGQSFGLWGGGGGGGCVIRKVRLTKQPLERPVRRNVLPGPGWMVIYPRAAEFKAITVDGGGNVIVTGWSGYLGGYLTLKFNGRGQLLWEREYTASMVKGGAVSVGVDQWDNIFVTGYAVTTDSGPSKILTVKYLPDGTQDWLQEYQVSLDSIDNSEFSYPLKMLAVDHAGNAYVTGRKFAGGIATFSITLQYTAKGGLGWSDLDPDSWYGHYTDNYPRDIAVDAQGGVYVAGTRREESGVKIFVTNYHSDGARAWTRDISAASGSLRAGALALDEDAGQVYVTGAKQSGSFSYDFYTTGLDSSAGTVLWSATYPGQDDPPAMSFPYGLVRGQDSGTFYLAGRLTQNKIVTLKYRVGQMSIGAIGAKSVGKQ